MALLIGNIFRQHAVTKPDRVAASLDDGLLTYAELDAQANRTAHVLQDLGLGVGDRVLWWGDTALDIVPVFAALAKIGAVFAPINARYGIDEAEDVARLARPSLLLASPTHAEDGAELAKRVGIERSARLGGDTGPDFDLTAAAASASADEPEVTGLDERDPHVIFFTSGSTGKPKGVVLSHRVNYLRTFPGNFGEVKTVVSMFPLFHMAGWTLALGAWQSRGEVVFVPTPTADNLLDAVERRQGTRLYLLPAVMARLLEADCSGRDLSTLTEIDTGTSATPPELMHGIKQAFPDCLTRVFYGSTECGTGARLADADVLRKPGSVGPGAVGVDLRVSESGEVQLRNEFMMDGYFENPEATAEAIVDGWYHTGDRGVLDEDGYLSIVGRVKDIIRTGGETVGPTEVESALNDHPGIAEVAVVGIPDPRWGEVVCAAIVPSGDPPPDVEALAAHCDGRLARYKQPRRVEVVDEIPRTAATRQIQRTLLVERILARSG